LRQTLADCPPRCRQWDWGYLNNLTHTEHVVLKPAGAWVFFTPDGNSLITVGGPRREVLLWDVHTGHRWRRFSESLGGVGVAAVSSDGTRLAGTDINRGLIRIWDVSTGHRVDRWPANNTSVYRLQFTHDGRQLVCFRERPARVEVWDTETHQLVRQIDMPNERAAYGALAPDDNSVAVALRKGTIRVFRLRDGTETTQWQLSSGSISKIAWSPDGTKLAIALKSGGIQVWRLATKQLITTCLEHAGGTTQVVFNHAGTRLACSGRNNMVHIWNANTGRLATTLRGHRANVRGLAFGPNDRQLAASAYDDTVRVWNLAYGEGTCVLDIPRGPLYALAFDPSGQELAIGTSTGEIRRYDARHFTALDTFVIHDQQVTALAYAPHQPRLAAVGRAAPVKIYDTRRRKLIMSLPLPWQTKPPPTNSSQRPRNTIVRSLTFSSDGRNLVCVGTNNLLQVWDVRTGKQRYALEAPTRDYRAVAVCPRQPWFAMASRDGNVEIRDLATGRCLQTIVCGKPPLWSVAFSSDGTILAAGAANGTFFFWDTRTWQAKKSLNNSLVRSRVALAFSPTGPRFVTAISGGSIDLWETGTCRPIMTLFSSTRTAPVVAFSPNGQTIAAGTTDGRLLIWTADPIN